MLVQQNHKRYKMSDRSTSELPLLAHDRIKGGFAQTDLNYEDLAVLHSACFEKSWNAKQIGEICAQSQNLTLMWVEPLGQIRGLIVIQVSNQEADIVTICVDPVKQNRGIAQILLNTSFDLLKHYNISELFLEVAKNNVPAIKIYEKLEFAVVGVRKKYFNNTTDAYVMKKQLALP